MKVLQINSVCGIGSTGRIATDLHKMLLENGHDSYIAYGRGKAANCENAIRIGSVLDNYNHVALTRLFDKHGFGSKRATKDFISQVEQLDPDIIHLHNIHGYYINIEVLFDYLSHANKPVVWTLHDCWSFTGHCTHFDFIGCNHWKTACYSCLQKTEYPSCIGFDRSKRNYEKKKQFFTSVKNMIIVSPSKWLAGLINESFLCKYAVRLIHNGINTSIFCPTESRLREQYNIQQKKIILGVASSWKERKKGIGYLIELAGKLGSSYQVVIVGVTDKQKKKLPHNILCINRTENPLELAQWYSTADIFVNPTLEDNYPMVNLEAISCGTPVITFDSGGSGESASLFGLVVNENNCRSLELALNLTSKFTKSYWNTKELDIEVSNTKYLETYSELIDNS